ncbi:hypothetical protein HHI36_020166 [Cryptolaemus montrouzieri]|uniref:phospholipase A2 n=1 Tax=Cryptolaemus montrouzieri TaxID=559131 RepID=A0ABD2N9T5_9CUCU
MTSIRTKRFCNLSSSFVEKTAQRGLLAPVFNAASRLAGMSHYNYKDESLSKYSFENLVGQAGENIYRGIKAATHIGDIVQGIAVGTRWCGNGNISRNDNDVGEFKETDECCRAHDMCASNIAARRREMNLKLQNDGTFTRFSIFIHF